MEVRAGHLKCIRRRLRNQEQICADWQVYAFFISRIFYLCFFLFTQPERTFRSTADYYVNTFQRDEAIKLFVLETVSTPIVPRTI